MPSLLDMALQEEQNPSLGLNLSAPDYQPNNPPVQLPQVLQQQMLPNSPLMEQQQIPPTIDLQEGTVDEDTNQPQNYISPASLKWQGLGEKLIRPMMMHLDLADDAIDKSGQKQYYRIDMPTLTEVMKQRALPELANNPEDSERLNNTIGAMRDVYSVYAPTGLPLREAASFLTSMDSDPIMHQGTPFSNSLRTSRDLMALELFNRVKETETKLGVPPMWESLWAAYDHASKAHDNELAQI